MENVAYVGTVTRNELAELLERAKVAHTEYETTNPPEHEWTEWYAQYIVNALNDAQRQYRRSISEAQNADGYR